MNQLEQSVSLVQRMWQGGAALLLVVVLGACGDVAKAPVTLGEPSVRLESSVKLTQDTSLNAQYTGVWGTIPAWAGANGWAKIDLTWANGGRGQMVLNNPGKTYTWIQFRSGGQSWANSPYVTPGYRNTFNWSYPGYPVSYSFRICRYLAGYANTCGQVLTIRPG